VTGWARRSDWVRFLGTVLVLMVAATVLRSATARADSLFSDGFESGNLNLWTGKTGLVVQQQEVYAGAWAARGTTTGAAAYAYKSLSPTQNELYTDLRFKVVSQGNVNVALVRFRTSTGAAIFSILRRNDGKLHYYNEITGAGIPSATVITTGVWHELKVHGLINGTAGLVEVWLDGIRLGDVSRTDNLGTNPIGRVYLGDPGTGKTWDIALDEVVVSTSADVTPPTVPTGLTATAIGATHGNLIWAAATDANGIAGYTIYRGGAPLATVGGGVTGYADFAAPAGTTSTYTVDAFDPAGNHSARSASASATTGSATGADPLILAVGDIACDPSNPDFNGGLGTAATCRQRYTSDIAFASNPTAILPLGDTQYEDATVAKYQQSFDPSWGRVKSIMHPVPGNHEYLSGGAGYFGYFGAAAGDPTKGYYSFDVGTWHVVVLNGECTYIGGCTAGSPEDVWLQADLAAHPSACTLATWHEPRFSSGQHGDAALDQFWQDLYAAHVDVVLNGHDHDYERFAYQNPAQQADPQGIREFVVGTGGEEFHDLGVLQPNSEVLNNDTFGVLEVTLHPTGYDWSFVNDGSGSFTDSGTDSCV